MTHGFGAAVDGGGDTNGDGYADVIIGAAREGVTAAGAAHVYLGWACRARIAGTTMVYTDLQAAVDAAVPGDTLETSGYCPGVSVREGLTQTLFISDTLTINGDLLPDFTVPLTPTDPNRVLTVLDPQGAGRALVLLGGSGNQTMTLRGLLLINGDAAGQDCDGQGFDCGGAAFVSDVLGLFRDSVIRDSVAETGGGLMAYDTSLVLDGVEMRSNQANGGDGGAVAAHQAMVTVVDSHIDTNFASELGGGLSLHLAGAMITGTKIWRNEANEGGGISLVDCGHPVIVTSQVLWNDAGSRGGGIYAEYGAPELANNFIGDNSSPVGAGVLTVNSDPNLDHNSIVANEVGPAVQMLRDDGQPHTMGMVNNLIAYNVTGVEADAGNTVNLDGVLWYSNAQDTAGAGTINVAHATAGDPLLRDAGDGDYWLAPYSAAIDRGVAASRVTDIEGDPRPTGSGSDLGADELVIDPPVSGLTVGNDGPTVNGQQTTLMASATSPVTITYDWDLGDSSTAVGSPVLHTYPHAGVYEAEVEATDSVNVVAGSTMVTVVDVGTIAAGESLRSSDDMVVIYLPIGTPTTVITYTPHAFAAIAGFLNPPVPLGFRLDASQVTVHRLMAFSPPLSVTVAYDDWSLQVVSPNENRMALHAWDSVAGRWRALPTVAHDTEANLLTAEVASTGTSFLLGIAEHRVFLPLVVR